MKKFPDDKGDQASPYIPPQHAKYGLLPRSHEDGSDVFAWPEELEALDRMIAEAEGDEDGAKSRVLPGPATTHAQFFANLRRYEERYRGVDDKLADAVATVAELVARANRKECWSVVRYTGKEKVGPNGLTPGRCYYWPCSPEHPVYEGVIDDEEFTSYLYPCDPSRWEILEDPLGMAARALAGEADTVDFWEVGPTELDRWAHERGLQAKRKTSYSMLPEEDAWGGSERDHVGFPCPQCGATIAFDAWTKVNARDDPQLVGAIIDGSFCEFTCPACGYTAHLAHPCLYLDPKHRACVYSVQGDAMRRQAEEMFAGLAEDDGADGPGGSVRRIVFGREELADKVAALEAGLDDRALELLKLGVAGQAMRQGQIPHDGEYQALFLGMEGDDLAIEVEAEGGQGVVGNIPMGAYEMFARELACSPIANDQPLYVDRAWAYEASDVLSRGQAG